MLLYTAFKFTTTKYIEREKSVFLFFKCIKMSLKLLPLKINKIFKKRKIKKFLCRLKRYVQNYKLSFIFYFNQFFYKCLNNSKKKLLRNIYVRDFFKLIRGFYSSRYKKQEIDKPNRYFESRKKLKNVIGSPKDERNKSLKECKINLYDTNKKKNYINKYRDTHYEKDFYNLDGSENYVIDLYDETSLPYKLQLINYDKLNNKTLSFDSDSDNKATHCSETSKTNENETCSYENLEYDEDEANESIKNCYLYNGYINATIYKKSEEYKFLRERLAFEKNDNLKISIETDSERENDCSEWEKINIKRRINNKLRNRENRKKKTKYEIYNSEITEKQNLYCTNYLNENFNSSSSSFSSSASSSSLYDSSSDENLSSGSEQSNAYTNSSYFENESINDYDENSSTCSDDSTESR